MIQDGIRATIFGGVVMMIFFITLYAPFNLTKIQALGISTVLASFMQMLFFIYMELVKINSYEPEEEAPKSCGGKCKCGKNDKSDY